MNNTTAVTPFNRFKLTVKEKSPEILTGASIAFGLGSAVFYVRGGVKVGPIIDAFRAELEECKAQDLDQNEMGKIMTQIYAKYIGKIALLFAPAVGMQAASIISMLAAKKIVDGRLAVVTTAYAALSATFDEFSNKVKEKYGEEEYYNLRFGDKKEEIVEVAEDDTVTVTKKPIAVNHTENSAIIAKGEHPFWMHDEDPGSILSMLLAIEKDMDRQLKAEGILFLNDVREHLRLPKSGFGQKYGWYYDPKNPKASNSVSFGLLHDPESWNNFMAGRDPWIWLEFNIDPRPVIQLLV